MRLVGNIRDITTRRDSKNKAIALYIDRVEYITHKKDGKYYQPFDFTDELETPLVITGDCLARLHPSLANDEEHIFKVYDVSEDGSYTLNEDKRLELATVFDYDSGETILSAVSYAVTVPNDEFAQLKRDRGNQQPGKQKKGKDRRRG